MVYCSQTEGVGNARVADSSRATRGFNEQRCHSSDVRGRSRRAKERCEVREGGDDPIGGSYVRFGTELMGREKQFTRSLRTKIFERVKTRIMHVNGPYRHCLTHAWMAKDTATGDVVLEHCDSPEGQKIQREGQGWSRHPVEHHAHRHWPPCRIGERDEFQRRSLGVQLVVIANCQGVASRVYQ